MKQALKYVIKLSVVALSTTLLFSCNDNLKNIQKLSFTEFLPVGEADSINLKYTDSGRIKTILVSPKMLDFTNVKAPFTEFPKGINLTLIDEQNNKSYITAQYAKVYSQTDIIEFNGNVKMTGAKGHFLETTQMYYDQKNQWFFTEQNFKFTAPNEAIVYGVGIDFSQDFAKVVYKNKRAFIEKFE